MPIVADPMKLSLPEQVGENKKQIKKIWEFLDGLSVSDNVIKITSLSQLTAEELEIVKREVAFIVYGNEIYYKTKTTSSEAIFEKLVKFELSEYVTLSSDKIIVTLSNGALGAESASVNIYSKAQVDSALALKAEKSYVDNNFAKLSGAAFTGAVTAPTLAQSQANYTVEANISVPEGATLDPNSFIAFKVVNGIMFLICEARIHNDSGASVTGNFSINSTVISSAYSSKIYRKDGSPCNENYSSTPVICNYLGVSQIKNSGTRNFIAGNLSSYSANRVSGYIPDVTVADGSWIDISYRLPIILI